MHGLSVKARMRPRSEILRMSRRLPESALEPLESMVRRANFEGYDTGVAIGKKDLKSEGKKRVAVRGRRDADAEGKAGAVDREWDRSEAKAELGGRRQFGEFHQIPKPCSTFAERMMRLAFYNAYYEGHEVWAFTTNLSRARLRETAWEESDAKAETEDLTDLVRGLRGQRA